MTQQHTDIELEQKFFRIMEESQKFFFFTRDGQGNFTYVDPKVERALGYTSDEFLCDWENLLSSHGDKGIRKNPLLEKPEVEGSARWEIEFSQKNGSSCWLEIFEKPVLDAAGKVVSTEGVACDITKRKSLELSMRFTVTRFREISDSSPIGIFQVDPDDRFIYVNLRCQTIAGRTLNNILGKPWWEIIHPDDIDNVFQAWPQAERENEELQVECRVLRPDGQVRWVEIRSKFFFHDDGKITFGTIEDISERKKTEDKLERYAEELKRSNKDLEEFAAIASHDLQEPLRKVMMFGERLFGNYSEVLDGTGLDYLERMRNATHRMQTFIDDLLQYSRVATKTQPFQPVDLKKVATEVLSDLEARVQRTQGRVDVGELPTLEADLFQMRQLFQNLIGNGLKFHQPEKPPVVTLNSKRLEDGSWEITVTDNGIGFEEQYLERIFKPFERLHGRSEYEGSGMGLAICQKIVKRHGGTITAKRAPQQGTTFIISLPEKQPTQE
ncbi:MAG: PAS domain S-box protein [Nitrospinaceae bacterium]